MYNIYNNRMNKILIGLLLCVVVVLLHTFLFENFEKFDVKVFWWFM